MTEPVHDTSLFPAPENSRILVLMCTYNERENLPLLIDRIRNVLPTADCLVIDDNSPDGTGKWATEYAAAHDFLKVIIRQGKRGLGSAIRQGLLHSIEQGYDKVINLDADLSHEPEAIPALMAATRGGADVAIGSRYISGGHSEGMSVWRKLISRMLNGYARLLLGLNVKDCSGSFRCYRVKHIAKLDWDAMTCDGYGFLEEILWHLNRQNTKFAEVPITYRLRHAGTSKITYREAIMALGVIHRLAAKS